MAAPFSDRDSERAWRVYGVEKVNKENGNLESVAMLVQLFVQLYSLVILARVLMSWVNIDPYSPLAHIIFNLTEPVLAPIRNLLPQTAGLDFSPIIAMVLLQIVGQMLVTMLLA